MTVTEMDYKALTEDYKQEQTTFPITLPKGQVLTCRTLPDGNEYIKIKAHSSVIVRLAKTNPLPEWKPFLPLDEKLIMAAVFCESCLVPPMPLVNGLEMAKSCGPLLMLIFTKMSEVLFPNAEEKEEELLEERKKLLSQTDFGEQPLQSVEIPTENILTTAQEENLTVLETS